jgi:hypothetical protein
MSRIYIKNSKRGMRYTPLLTIGLLLSLTASVFAQVAECPNWQVGDEWAWGESYNLGEILSPLFRQLEENGAVRGWKCGGKLEGYVVSRVEAVEGEHYLTSMKGGAELSDFRVSLTSPEMQGASVNVSGSGVAKVYGTSRLTRQLAYENGEMTIIGNLSLNLQVPGLDMNFKLRDIQCFLSVSYEEPLDTFQFPIEVSENWSFQGLGHFRLSVHGWAEGKISMLNYENSFSEEIKLDEENDWLVQGSCVCTRTVEMDVDGQRDNCFEVKIYSTETGTIPIAFTAYYSPAKKSWVAFTVSWEDLLSTVESAIETTESRAPSQLSGSFEKLEESLQSLGEVMGTLTVTSLSPQEALKRIEAMGKGTQTPWVLMAVPVAIIICILLVKKFY